MKAKTGIRAGLLRSPLEELRYNRLYYLMALIPLGFLFVFSYVPMYGLVMAFQRFSPGLGFARSPWVGLENYKFIFSLPDIQRVVWNTLIIAVQKILFRQLAAILFAVLLNELGARFLKRAVQTISYLPHFLSWVILGGAFVALLSRTGPINRIIEALGGEAIFFLGSNAWFRPTIILTDVWQNFGFSSIVYLAALTSIDPGLYESAVIDGANRLQQIFYITLPGIATTIVLLAVLALGGVLSAGFEQILVLYNPAVYQTGDVIDTWIYRYGLQEARYSIATAVGLFKSAIGCSLVFISKSLAKRFANYQVF